MRNIIYEWNTFNHLSHHNELLLPNATVYCGVVKRHWNRRAAGKSLQRHMRSEIWWFTEICNSQCVSHFAASFIDARAKTSIAESFSAFFYFSQNLICSCSIFHLKWWTWTRTHKGFHMVLWMNRKKNRCGRERIDSRVGMVIYRLESTPGITQRQLHHGMEAIVDVPNMCEWSFRRFTYGNRVTTFASFRGLYLRNFPTCNAKRSRSVRWVHRTLRSVAATGGVYKGQGRNRRKLLTCAY